MANMKKEVDLHNSFDLSQTGTQEHKEQLEILHSFTDIQFEIKTFARRQDLVLVHAERKTFANLIYQFKSRTPTARARLQELVQKHKDDDAQAAVQQMFDRMARILIELSLDDHACLA